MAISPNQREQEVLNEVELETAYAIVQLPVDAVEVGIHAKVYIDGKIKTVQMGLSMKQIREAIQEADDYIGPDTVITLTEKGRREAEKWTE